MYVLHKVKTILEVATIVVAAAVLAYPCKTAALNATGRTLTMESVESSLGSGFLFGILGGYRSLISDFAWIKSYIDWEKKDLPACLASMELAASIDPYMTTYWTQGAAIIAFDTPHWLMSKLPPDNRNARTLAMLKKRQSQIAFGFLDKALKMFPLNAQILIKKGQIAISIDDFKTAENCFGKVANQKNPSIYSRRIYASLLAKNGKMRQSNTVLESVLRDLDSDSPAVKDVKEQIAKNNSAIERAEIK